MGALLVALAPAVGRGAEATSSAAPAATDAAAASAPQRNERILEHVARIAANLRGREAQASTPAAADFGGDGNYLDIPAFLRRQAD